MPYHQLATPQSMDFLHSAAVALPLKLAELAPYPYYFNLSENLSLSSVLRKSYCFFLETGTRDVLENALEDMFVINPMFALSLTTATAYHSDTSSIIACALEERFFLDMQKRIAIRTCLQEALANAIIHGNLSLISPKTCPVSFHHFHEAIAARMEQNYYRNLRITIMAWCNESEFTLSISDQGSGFSSQHMSKHSESNESFCGRGLLLIQSLASRVWIKNDLKTLCMTFTQ